MDERCERCDRAECRRERLNEVTCQPGSGDAYQAYRRAAADCAEYEVDWRARCLRAEQALTTAREDERRVGSGVERIAAERARQVLAEGWTPEHDDEHDRGEMAIAAACYAVNGTDVEVKYDDNGDGWPWDAEWWKPTPDDRVRELAKAGALIAAEIDRLLRAREAEQAGEAGNG